MPDAQPERSLSKSSVALPVLTEEQILATASERVAHAAPRIKDVVVQHMASMRSWKKSGSQGDAPTLKIPGPASDLSWNAEERPSVQALINIYAKPSTTGIPTKSKPPVPTKSADDLAMEILSGGALSETTPYVPLSAQTLGEVEALQPGQVSEKRKAEAAQVPAHGDSSTMAALALSKYMKRPRN